MRARVRRVRRRLVRATRVGIIVAFFSFVEVAARAGWIDQLALVPVTVMVQQLIEYFQNGQIYPHLASTGASFLSTIMLAIVTGIPFGIALWRIPVLERMLNPYLTSYYAIPVFVFYPLLIVFFGITVWPLILISWAYAVVAVVVNTSYGFREVPLILRKVARIHRLGWWPRFWKVEFPAASPYVFNGLKLAVAYGLVAVIASEFILSTRGLGWVIAYNYNSFQVSKMYAGILLVLVISIFVYVLLSLVQRRLGHVRR
ncbi:MAG: ABC transporter permease subunit [Actinobacteria bacterium]|nr:ABC transporter permease subunit [Actinomycetota bacterium]